MRIEASVTCVGGLSLPAIGLPKVTLHAPPSVSISPFAATNAPSRLAGNHRYALPCPVLSRVRRASGR
jgi:hypothetical protein